MKRIFDIFTSVIVIGMFFWLMLVITILILYTSKGPILYWSDRIGKDNKIFRMPKFRSMIFGAPEVATHKLINPEKYLSPIGSFLRRSSLDELPQVISILKGDMSFIGPRPALHNQYDLINLRTQKGIHKLLPGITGWAQINGRDDLSIEAKVKLDEEYLKKNSFWFDIKIFILTVIKIFSSKGVSH